MRFTRITLTLTLVGFSLVLAQDTLIGRTLDADGWVTQLQADIVTYIPSIVDIARGLAGVALIASLIWCLRRSDLISIVDVFLRALIVSGLLLLAPQFLNLTMGVTENLRVWSMDQLEDSFREGAEEMAQLGADSSALLMGVGVAKAGLTTVVTKGPMIAAEEAASINAANIVKFANFVVLPVAFFIISVHVIALLALIAVAIANIVFPIAAAMLMFGPANGEKWLGAYISTVVTSILVVAFIPFAFKAAFNIAVVQPVRAINDNFADFNDLWNDNSDLPAELLTIEQQLEGLYAEQDDIKSQAWDAGDPTLAFHPELRERYSDVQTQIDALKQLRDEVGWSWRQELSRTITRTIEGVLAAFRNWFLRLLLMFVGIFIGGLIFAHYTRVVAGLVQGVAIQAVQIASSPLKALSGVVSGGSVAQRTRDIERRPSKLAADNHSRPVLTGPSRGGGR
jgi:hypothetical protein